MCWEPTVRSAEQLGLRTCSHSGPLFGPCVAALVFGGVEHRRRPPDPRAKRGASCSRHAREPDGGRGPASNKRKRRALVGSMRDVQNRNAREIGAPANQETWMTVLQALIVGCERMPHLPDSGVDDICFFRQPAILTAHGSNAAASGPGPTMLGSPRLSIAVALSRSPWWAGLLHAGAPASGPATIRRHQTKKQTGQPRIAFWPPGTGLLAVLSRTHQAHLAGSAARRLRSMTRACSGKEATLIAARSARACPWGHRTSSCPRGMDNCAVRSQSNAQREVVAK